MDLMQLHYFRVAAEKGNFTQAAAELHITQPALSKTISNLEEELGMQLFDRIGKRIYLNDCGKTVLRYTGDVFDRLDSMKRELSDMRDTISGTLNIGFSLPTREPDLFLITMRQFLADYPAVRLSYKQMGVLNLQEQLRSGTIDIAITSSAIEAPDIVWVQEYSERLGIILSKDHRLAAQEDVSILDLRDEDFFCNNSSDDLQDLTYYFCACAGYKPKVKFEGHFPLYIGEAISRGEGVSFIPETQYTRQYDRDTESGALPWAANIAFRRVREEYCVRSCGYAYLKGRYMPLAAREFCARINRSFASAPHDPIVKAYPAPPAQFS